MGKREKKGGPEQAKCPKCESDLHLVDKVGQHYCFSCETYFPPDELVKKEEAEEAPACASPEPVVKETPVVKADDKTVEEAKAPEKMPEEKPEPGQERVEEELPDPDAMKGASKPEEAPEPKAGPEPEPAPAAEPAPAEAAPADVVDVAGKPPEEEIRSCPSCEDALTYVAKYDRWYCYKCRKYAQKGAAIPTGQEVRKCPTCGESAQFIDRYQRWYCWSCKKYLPKDETAAKAKELQTPLCAICGRPTTWIANYERYYCYPCNKYAPKAEARKEPRPAPAAAPTPRAAEAAKPAAPACAYCGKPTTWVAKYERYYCYPCQKYVPKEQPKKEKPAAQKGDGAPLCAYCGKPTTWIAKYERHYCYPCKKYAPK